MATKEELQGIIENSDNTINSHQTIINNALTKIESHRETLRNLISQRTNSVQAIKRAQDAKDVAQNQLKVILASEKTDE